MCEEKNMGNSELLMWSTSDVQKPLKIELKGKEIEEVRKFNYPYRYGDMELEGKYRLSEGRGAWMIGGLVCHCWQSRNCGRRGSPASFTWF